MTLSRGHGSLIFFAGRRKDRIRHFAAFFAGVREKKRNRPRETAVRRLTFDCFLDILRNDVIWHLYFYPRHSSYRMNNRRGRSRRSFRLTLAPVRPGEQTKQSKIHRFFGRAARESALYPLRPPCAGRPRSSAAHADSRGLPKIFDRKREGFLSGKPKNAAILLYGKG